MRKYLFVLAIAAFTLVGCRSSKEASKTNQKEVWQTMLVKQLDAKVEDQIIETCDDVGVVYAGQIIEFGSKEQVFRRPMHPYTQGLFGAIPALTGDVDRLTPIKGAPPDPTHLPVGCNFGVRCPHYTAECGKGEIPVFTMADGHRCQCLLYKDEAVNASQE